MNFDEFYCLDENELMEIDGGIDPFTIAAIAIGGVAAFGFCMGIYNGYMASGPKSV